MTIPQRTEAEKEFLSITERLLERSHEVSHSQGMADADGDSYYYTESRPDEYDLFDALTAAGLKIVRG